jgi:hypothetical protein
LSFGFSGSAMSTDPQPFEEDLEALEPQAAPDEAAQPAGVFGKRKREKKPKANKEKAQSPKTPRASSGGFRRFLGEQFPDVYTALLGVAVLAIILAVVLLVIEFFVHYGGERRPTGAVSVLPPAAQSTTLSMAA